MTRFVHFVTQGYSLSVVKPLIAEVRRRGAGESLLFVPPRLKHLVDFEVAVTSSFTEACHFCPDIVFVPGNVIPYRLPGLKVQIFHGLCEEKGGHYKITGFFDLYCTSGPLITSRFQQLAAHWGHFAVQETGWPKVDSILAPYERRALCQRLGLNAEHKIVLYAPTFSPKFKSTDIIRPVLPTLPRPDEIWLIKFHDLMPVKEQRFFQNLSRDSFRIIEGYDNVPLLQAADILVSDTSSIVYEFLLLDKPVITIGALVRLEKGLNVLRSADLRPALDACRTHPQQLSAQRRLVMAQIHPYRDCDNSRRVIAAAEEFLHTGQWHKLRRKPLNLFRKWQVLSLMRTWDKR